MRTHSPSFAFPRPNHWFARAGNGSTGPALGSAGPAPQPSTVRIRVVLADDHRLVRAGLRLLLAGMPQFEVVAEASNGSEAVRVVAQHAPDIAVLDVSMPGVSGLAALREMRATHPNTKVLLLSMYDNQEYVTEAIQSGAAGYLLKDCAVDELARALSAVALGQTYLSPGVSRQVARAISNPKEKGPDGLLTMRQAEILRHVALGQSSREIAQQLSLSIKTVESHRNQIMGRLGIRDLAGLVRYAVRNGMISSEE
jgi:DNA-binding NarL/FixJ family response regulator